MGLIKRSAGYAAIANIETISRLRGGKDARNHPGTAALPTIGELLFDDEFEPLPVATVIYGRRVVTRSAWNSGRRSIHAEVVLYLSSYYPCEFPL